MSKLANKVALVTGGSRGIGAAIAKRLAADGASVAITYAKDASAASVVVKAIELGGGRAIAIQADAADAKAVKDAVEKAVATFGRLDVLVNNAGTAIPKPFEETTLEEMDRVSSLSTFPRQTSSRRLQMPRVISTSALSSPMLAPEIPVSS
jgi:3-oxoacyl-[acyl-carrier protein] reductase